MTPTNRLINNNDDKDTHKHHRCVKVRPHPLAANQRDVLYAWKGRALYRFPSNINKMSSTHKITRNDRLIRPLVASLTTLTKLD